MAMYALSGCLVAGEGASQENNGKKCSKQKKEEVQKP